MLVVSRNLRRWNFIYLCANYGLAIATVDILTALSAEIEKLEEDESYAESVIEAEGHATPARSSKDYSQAYDEAYAESYTESDAESDDASGSYAEGSSYAEAYAESYADSYAAGYDESYAEANAESYTDSES